MEIQQHDGVVVEVAAISAGLRQAQREGEVLAISATVVVHVYR